MQKAVQELSYVGRAAGKRQTYHVFLGGEYFFVLSFSRAKPNAGNFNVVKLGAVEYVRARFAGSKAVTTNDVVARAERSRPAFTVTSADPVMLTISHATTRNLGGPLVEITGTVITIRQIDLDTPPPPGPPGPEPCNNRTASLGTLPPGNYTVNWHYAVPQALPGGPFGSLESFTFAFAHGLETVPALDGPALCGLILLFGTLGVLLLRR